MTKTLPANWAAAIDDQQHQPVYFVDIDGLTDDYATAPVKGASPAKDVRMRVPTGGGVVTDLLRGSRSVQEIEFDLLDVDGEITTLVSTEAGGAPVSTLINRQVTMYGGQRTLDEADFATLFSGRISGVSLVDGSTAYRFRASDNSYLLDGEIMSDATSTKPTSITGNPFNLYWSILTGTFSTVHADFPLTSVSTASGSSSAPTGLGIATPLIDEDQIKLARDQWHSEDVAEVVFNDPVAARSHLETEFFRVWQCDPGPGSDGKIGIKLHRHTLPSSAATAVTQSEHILDYSWRRRYDLHLNRFQIYIETTKGSGTFDDLVQGSADTADESATGESVKLRVESRWLQDDQDLADQLIAYWKTRYVKTPAEVTLLVNMRRLNIEPGDSIAVTHDGIPDLFDGSRGVTSKLFFVVSVEPDFTAGAIRLVCMDLGFNRFGVISPTGTADYGSATDLEKNTFCWIGDATTNEVGSAEVGYAIL